MNRKEASIPVPLLRELIHMDEGGNLFWKERQPHHCQQTATRTAEHICKNWNSRHAGMPAFAHVDQFGHLTGRLFRHLLYAHRVVFALTHGRWPEHTIDHINGNPADNSPSNLRDVPHQENHRNTRMRKNSTSGAMGVSMNKRLGKWAAHITVDGDFVHLGFYADKADAVAARKNAEARHGFHTNHGRVAA